MQESPKVRFRLDLAKGSHDHITPQAAVELKPPTRNRNLHNADDLLTMSLPRSNYDPRRVCLNPFPALSFGKYRRTIGIYLAGGLVRLRSSTYEECKLIMLFISRCSLYRFIFRELNQRH